MRYVSGYLGSADSAPEWRPGRRPQFSVQLDRYISSGRSAKVRYTDSSGRHARYPSVAERRSWRTIYFSPRCFCAHLNLEVDVVVHSATKFLCGHSGSLSGIVISNNAEFVAKLRKAPKSMEACSVRLTFPCSPRHRNPPDASKTTLHQRTGDSGVLAQRPAVTEVRYPGLSGDHAHKTVKDLLAGSVGLVDFVVAGDQEVIRYFQKLRGIYATPGRCEHAGLLPKSRAARRYP